MSIVLVYAVLIMGLFSTVGYLADSRLNSAFPSIDDLEENRVALENDSFNELRNSIPPSAQMVIFDQNGNRLYACLLYTSCTRKSGSDVVTASTVR